MSFPKRSLHFVKVSPTQVLPLILHLEDRKSFTQDIFNELVCELGRRLNSKFKMDDYGRKSFLPSFVDKHINFDQSLAFSTPNLRYFYYFQDTYPTQFMAIPKVIILLFI